MNISATIVYSFRRALPVFIFIYFISVLPSCSEPKDTSVFRNIEGEWVIQHVVVGDDGGVPVVEWHGVKVNINIQDDDNLLIKVIDTPNDSIWSPSSIWQKISGEGTKYILKESQNFPLLEAELEIKTKDDIIVSRFVPFLFPVLPNGNTILPICCYWIFSLTRDNKLTRQQSK